MIRILDPSEVMAELGLSSSITDEERMVVNQAIVKAEGAAKKFLRYDPVLRRRTEYYPRYDANIAHRVSIMEVSSVDAYERQLQTGRTTELQLSHIPIRTSTAMELRIDYDGRSGAKDGAFGDETIKTEGTDYWANYDLLDRNGDKVCSDGLLRSMGLWPSSAGTVRVVYTAGYTEAELRGEDQPDAEGNDVLDASPIWTAVLEEAKRKVEQVMLRKKGALGWGAGPKTSEQLGDYRYTIDASMAKSLYGNTMELTDESKMLLTPFMHMGLDV